MVGMLLGGLLALFLIHFFTDTLVWKTVNRTEQSGKTYSISEDMTIFQNGQAVGRIAKGTRLWSQHDPSLTQHAELLLKWKSDGNSAAFILDDVTSTDVEANAILKKHEE